MIDLAGDLPDHVAPWVRVLLGAVGRMGAGSMAEAFHPDLVGRTPLRAVETDDEQ